jgi:5-oxoprolinase (ATP-hydrolysing)
MRQKTGPRVLLPEEAAMGFIHVANEAMCRPIRALTQAKGYDITKHVLSVFGGAGGQHACAIARALGMRTVFLHRFAGVLSAYGLGLAEVVQEEQEPAQKVYRAEHMADFQVRFLVTQAAKVCVSWKSFCGCARVVVFYGPVWLLLLQARLEALAAVGVAKLRDQGFDVGTIHVQHFLNMRYEGTDTAMMTNPEAGVPLCGGWRACILVLSRECILFLF